MANKFLAVVVLIILSAVTLCYANHSAVVITGDTPDKDSKSGLNTWQTGEVISPTKETTSKGYDEFWNDTYLMWELLYKNKGWANNDIYVLYGTNADYPTGNTRYKAIDQTGVDHITDYGAYYADVANIFSWLANGNAGLGIPQMTSNDFLFGFTFNHGGSTGNNNSTLGLMDGQITDTDYASKVDAIACWARVFWMQQCFSGGFVDNLTNSKTVINTACSGSESAYRADNSSRNGSPLPENETSNSVVYNHGEFNFHVMNAQRGTAISPYGNPPAVNADYDGNGKISVKESFDYVASHYTEIFGSQTPQLNDPNNWRYYLYLDYAKLNYKQGTVALSGTITPVPAKGPADCYVDLSWTTTIGSVPIKSAIVMVSTFNNNVWSLCDTVFTGNTYRYQCSPGPYGIAFKVFGCDGVTNVPSNKKVLYNPNPSDPIVAYSTTSEATSYSNGKKLVIDNTGKLHVVFASNDTVYYTTSTDDGNTWLIQTAVGEGKNPAIELNSNQMPSVCWSKVNELYYTEHSANVWGAPQLIYTGPAGSEVSYLSYVLDQKTNNSYLGWVDEGAASAVYISPYTPGGSGQLAPTPIDQGGAGSFKSPSLTLDRGGNLKATWSNNGRVYYFDETGQLELGENGIHPIVDTYGDKTSVVWQEEISPGLYQIAKRNKCPLGWGEKQVISYPDEKNADFPVVAANGQYVYSKNTTGNDYDIVWHGEYDNGWVQYERNISYASGGISKYPSVAFRQLWPKSKLYILWTEDLPDAKAAVPAKPVKIYAQEVDPVPYFYADLGTDEAAVYTMQKQGSLYYGQTPDLTIDYHPTQLKYSFTGLDPARYYMLKAVYYHESNDRIQQKMKVDGQQFDVANLKPKEMTEFKRWLVPNLYSDGQVEITIDKQKGEYAVCAVLSIEEYEKECDQTKGGGAQTTESKPITATFSYALMQNTPNPCSQHTAIDYQLAKQGQVSLKVYNTLGQVVKTLVSENQNPGSYNVKWDGKDEMDRQVTAGIYFYRLASGEFNSTKKMVVLR